MLIGTRYEKGHGSSSIYLRVRNQANQFYNFVTFNWDVVESSNAMVYLQEQADSDPTDSLYTCNPTLPLIDHVQELVDSTNSSVIGIGVYDAPSAVSTLTLADIEASTVLMKNTDTRLAYLDAPISMTATYTQVDSMFTPMVDLLSQIVLNTSGGGSGGSNQDITDIADALLGSWEIVNKQMIFYRRDNSELMRFDLTDKFGNPSEHSVFKRNKV